MSNQTNSAPDGSANKYPGEIFAEFPLEEYKNRYFITSHGRVYSKKIKKGCKTHISDERNIVIIEGLSYKVDELVAAAFLGDKGEFLCHLDGNMTNDKSDNLQWMSYINYLVGKYGDNWKPIEEMAAYYVSDKGQIWSSVTRKIIDQQIVSGCPSVSVGYPKRIFQQVHRFVAKAFIPNPKNLPIVNHKDGDRLNCCADNLVWASVEDHALRTHRLPETKVKPRKEGTIADENLDEQLYGVVLDWLPGYMITQNGNVFNLTSRIFLKRRENTCGYLRVSCGKEYQGLYVHRLVAEAWLDSPKEGQTQVNHIDMDRKNCNYKNLEWCSPSENNKHAVENNPNRSSHLKKRVAQINKETKEIIKIHDSVHKASKDTGINSGSISKACKIITKAPGGFFWRLVDKDNNFIVVPDGPTTSHSGSLQISC